METQVSITYEHQFPDSYKNSQDYYNKKWILDYTGEVMGGMDTDPTFAASVFWHNANRFNRVSFEKKESSKEIQYRTVNDTVKKYDAIDIAGILGDSESLKRNFGNSSQLLRSRYQNISEDPNSYYGDFFMEFVRYADRLKGDFNFYKEMASSIEMSLTTALAKYPSIANMYQQNVCEYLKNEFKNLENNSGIIANSVKNLLDIRKAQGTSDITTNNNIKEIFRMVKAEREQTIQILSQYQDTFEKILNFMANSFKEVLINSRIAVPTGKDVVKFAFSEEYMGFLGDSMSDSSEKFINQVTEKNIAELAESFVRIKQETSNIEEQLEKVDILTPDLFSTSSNQFTMSIKSFVASVKEYLDPSIKQQQAALKTCSKIFEQISDEIKSGYNNIFIGEEYNFLDRLSSLENKYRMETGANDATLSVKLYGNLLDSEMIKKNKLKADKTYKLKSIDNLNEVKTNDWKDIMKTFVIQPMKISTQAFYDSMEEICNRYERDIKQGFFGSSGGELTAPENIIKVFEIIKENVLSDYYNEIDKKEYINREGIFIDGITKTDKRPLLKKESGKSHLENIKNYVNSEKTSIKNSVLVASRYMRALEYSLAMIGTVMFKIKNNYEIAFKKNYDYLKDEKLAEMFIYNTTLQQSIDLIKNTTGQKITEKLITQAVMALLQKKLLAFYKRNIPRNYPIKYKIKGIDNDTEQFDGLKKSLVGKLGETETIEISVIDKGGPLKLFDYKNFDSFEDATKTIVDNVEFLLERRQDMIRLASELRGIVDRLVSVQKENEILQNELKENEKFINERLTELERMDLSDDSKQVSDTSSESEKESKTGSKGLISSQKEVKELQLEKARLEKNKMALENEKAMLKLKYDTLVPKIKTLYEKVKEKADDDKLIPNQMDKILTRVKIIMEELERLQKKPTEDSPSEAELNSLSLKLTEMQELLRENPKAIIETFKTKNAQAESIIKAITQMKRIRDTLQSENVDLKLQKATLEKEKTALETQLKNKEEEYTKLSRDIQNKNSEIADLTISKNESDRDYEALTEEIKDTVTRLNIKVEKEDNEYKKLEKLEEEIKSNRQNLNNINRSLENITEKIRLNGIKKEKESLRSFEDKAKLIDQAIENCNTISEEIEKIANYDLQLFTQNKKTKDDASTDYGKILFIKSEIEAKTKTNGELETIITGASSKLDDVARTVGANVSAVGIKKLNDKIDKISGVINTLKFSKKESKGKLITLQNEKNTLDASLEALKKEKEELETKKKKLTTELSNANSDIMAKNERISSLNSTIKTKEETIKNQKEMIQTRDVKIRELETQLKKNKDAMEALNKEIEQCETEKKDLTDRISNLTAQATEDAKTLTGLRDTVIELGKTNQTFTQEQNDEIETLSQENQKLTIKLAQLEREKETYETTKKGKYEEQRPAQQQPVKKKRATGTENFDPSQSFLQTPQVIPIPQPSGSSGVKRPQTTPEKQQDRPSQDFRKTKKIFKAGESGKKEKIRSKTSENVPDVSSKQPGQTESEIMTEPDDDYETYKSKERRGGTPEEVKDIRDIRSKKKRLDGDGGTTAYEGPEIQTSYVTNLGPEIFGSGSLNDVNMQEIIANMVLSSSTGSFDSTDQQTQTIYSTSENPFSRTPEEVPSLQDFLGSQEEIDIEQPSDIKYKMKNRPSNLKKYRHLFM